MRRVSAKHKGRTAKYYAIRNEWMKDHPWCEICRTIGHSMVATDCHHRKGRSGNLLFDTRYFAALCRFHHGMVHDNPKWAREHGWLISKFKKD